MYSVFGLLAVGTFNYGKEILYREHLEESRRPTGFQEIRVTLISISQGSAAKDMYYKLISLRHTHGCRALLYIPFLSLFYLYSIWRKQNKDSVKFKSEYLLNLTQKKYFFSRIHSNPVDRNRFSSIQKKYV